MDRILQVLSGLNKNGIESSVMNVYRCLNRDEVLFDFLIFSDSTDGFYDEIKSLGGEIYVIKSNKKGVGGLYEHYALCLKFFKENAYKYKAVHVNFCYITTFAPFWAARKYGIKKIICHAHGSSYVGGWKCLFMHKVFRYFMVLFATDYVACSSCAADWFYKGTTAYKKSKIIFNGVNLKLYSYDIHKRNRLRKSFNISNDTLVIGQIGYFSKVKNHLFTIAVLKRLVKMSLDVKLLLIGSDGGMEKAIRAEIKKSNLDNYVFFLGHRDDIPDIMQALDLFFMPSLHEGFPLSLVEAQAAGLKILSSDKITKEVTFTDNIIFLPIDKGADIWVESINAMKDYDRESLDKDIYSSKYAIENSSKQYLLLYN